MPVRSTVRLGPVRAGLVSAGRGDIDVLYAFAGCGGTEVACGVGNGGQVGGEAEVIVQVVVGDVADHGRVDARASDGQQREVRARLPVVGPGRVMSQGERVAVADPAQELDPRPGGQRAGDRQHGPGSHGGGLGVALDGSVAVNRVSWPDPQGQQGPSDTVRCDQEPWPVASKRASQSW